MPLEPGSRIGSYEIGALLGAGGMGEVYRATDTKLGRAVALKILPAALARDADRLARFAREARVLAALNHPNIAQIHGFEESGSVHALVMELVEGEELSARIARGPMAFADALPIARQLAEALESAHAHGIVHRDLKPANIKVRDDGTVKVLDFGLAKAFENPGASLAADASAEEPTITSPALTHLGVILGTAAYMAPEQAKGRPVDSRADVWAFGCVLYEMLTGARAFDREDVTETIAAVVQSEPDWRALPADVPAMLAVFLRRCLCKAPQDRVQDIGDVRLALAGAFDPPADALTQTASAAGDRRRGPLATAALVTALVLAAAAVGWFVRPGDARSGGTSVRFLLTPTDPPLTIGSLNRAIAITRDGSRLLYYAGRGPTRALYERRLDDALAPPTLLRQGERFFELFVSPDGSWIGFNDESDLTLKKMPARGGPPVPVVAAEKEITGGLWGITGAAWAPDNTIVYGLNSGNFGLWRVAASGGPPERLTTPDKARGELAHGWPAVLPGGRALLYTVRSEVRENPFQIWCKDLRTGAEKSLLTGAGPRYAAGYLVYGIEGDIWAAPFDPEQLKVVGDAVRLVEGVYSHERGRVDFDVSDDGTLVYVTTAVPAPRRLVWLDRARGTVRTPIDAPQRLYSAVRISGDGAQAALVVGDQATDIFLLDFAGPSLRQLTADRAIETSPTWTRDGRLLFSSNRSGRTNIYVQSAIGGPATQLTDNDRASLPNAILPDGRLLYQESHPRTTADLMLWAFETKAEPVGLVEDPNGQMNGRLSADAGWLAYQSDERYFGVREIFVRPFPVAAGQQVQVTSAGGVQPAWARRTNELFYLSNGDLFASTVRVGAAPTVPQLVAKGPFQGFDVGADGRILVIEEVSSAPAAQSVGVVVNWIDRLRSGRRRQPDRLR